MAIGQQPADHYNFHGHQVISLPLCRSTGMLDLERGKAKTIQATKNGRRSADITTEIEIRGKGIARA